MATNNDQDKGRATHFATNAGTEPDLSHLSSGATGVRPATQLSSRTVRATNSVNGRGRNDRRPRRGNGVLSALLALLIVGGAAFAVIHFVLPRVLPGSDDTGDTRPQVEQGITVDVVIPEGSGATAIAQILYEAGVIDDTGAFLNAMKRQDAEQSLKSGAYLLVTGSDPAEVVRQLVSGPNSATDRLTVSEGLTVAKTAAAAEAALDLPATDFEAAAVASAYVEDYPFLSMAENDSLEGFLFPKTYDFSGREYTIDTVIRAMLDQWSAELGEFDFAGAASSINERYGIDLDAYDVIIVASVIERETNTDADRATVASVIYNRLQAGMPLQCDSTIEYVVGHQPSGEDLEIDSPYNSYTNYGLPPTPICSPSLESIQAAAEPEDTDYYYFLIIGDDHTFSRTYDEHLQAIAES